MTGRDGAALHWHEDPEQFRAAVSFTAATTGFSGRLVEKDYFCTIVLAYLAGIAGLVFKGGTCLAKVYAEFYRLSEDLDFVVSTPTSATRGQRSARAAGVKHAVAKLPARVPALRVLEPLRGANDSTQYLATLAYTSVLTGGDEPIKVEVGLREPLLDEPTLRGATTVLLDPATNAPLLAPVQLACISLREALAEKLRAALSRREVAIRDFFDLDYAERALGLDLRAPDMVDLVSSKLRVPGNLPVDVSSKRLTELQSQVRARLQPVLRRKDMAAFDLDRALRIVKDVATALGLIS